MMVRRIRCNDCENYIDALSQEGTFLCECGGLMEFEGMAGCVIGSGSDIRPGARELLEGWRDEIPGDPFEHIQNRGEYQGMARCIGDLEELIEDV